MKVLRINASDTHIIRHKMLRQDFSLEECIFPGDEDDQSFHLGAFIDNKLVSVASFYYESSPEFKSAHEHQYRLRGMATLPEFQGQGLSSELLKMAFPMIKQNFCSLLWCNARVSAEGFYTKVGFKPHGAIFEIPSIGPHILMSKEID